MECTYAIKKRKMSVYTTDALEISSDSDEEEIC